MALSIRSASHDTMHAALITDIGNAARLRIYSGSVPASANAALGANTLLADLACGSPFGASSGGTLTANAITTTPSAAASGTATFFRIYNAAGSTCYVQGTAGTSGTDLVLNTTSIVAGGPVAVNSFTIVGG